MPMQSTEEARGSGRIIILPSEPNIEEFKMDVYLLVSNQFKLIGTDNHKRITMYRNEPKSTRTSFNVKVEQSAQGTGYVTALFYYQGYPCGRVRRAITVGYRDNPEDVKKSQQASNEEINSSPAVAASDTAVLASDTTGGTTPSSGGPYLTINRLDQDR